MKTRIFLALAFSLLFAACDKKSDTATPTTSTAATAPSSSAPTVATGSAASSGQTATSTPDDDIPTEEDFEDEAEKDVNPDNLEAELAKLEKEVK